MMPFFFAWAIGEGIIVYRWIKAGAPPTPGALLVPSGLYLGLAIIAEADEVRPVATAFAFAVDLAVLLQIVGKEPAQQTNWPPVLISDPAVLLPGGGAATGNTTANTGTSSGASGAAANVSAGITGGVAGLTGGL